MVTPPTDNMSREVLAAARIAGVDKVIAVGGVQAIAALTYGAGIIPQVDKIVGQMCIIDSPCGGERRGQINTDRGGGGRHGV